MNNQRQRELTFFLRDEVCRELEETLDLKAPCRVNLSESRQKRLHGTYYHVQRLIVLEMGVELFTNSRLLAVQREVIETLLHEYRHAYQFDHWDATRIAKDQLLPYHEQEIERDANEWASQNTAKWLRLGRVQSKRVYSNMRRLSQAEARVR